MPMISFKGRFVPLVETGLKRQTVRFVRTQPIKRGDILILATGARTTHYRRLTLDTSTGNFAGAEIISAAEGHVRCLEAIPVSLRVNGERPCDPPLVILGGKRLSKKNRDRFAILDGFSYIEEMAAWFIRTYRLRGQWELNNLVALRW